jgi:hypothetical protein
LLKKRLYIALSVVFCCFTAGNVNAQLTINLPEANISGQTEYTTNFPSGTTALISLLPTIQAKFGSANFSGTPATLPSIPSSTNFMKMKVTQLGLSLISTFPQITLSTTSQTVITSLLSLGAAIRADYTIVTSAFPWAAGSYANTVVLTGGLSSNPTTLSMTITVPAYITLNNQVPSTTTLNVTSFAQFRDPAGISATVNNDYFTTVPTLFSLKANSSTFSFSTTQPYNHLPAANNVSLMNSALTGPYAGSAINLSSTDQLLTSSTGIPVLLTNKSSIVSALGITGANLSSNFVQAGTYITPLVYTISKTAASFPATPISQTMSSNVQVNVSNIMEVVVLGSQIDLTVNTAAKYQQGVTTTVPNQVRLSSTVPYNITVKASGPNLSSSGGVNIPVGVITIEGMPGQTGITPIVLSASPQTIITSGDPIIDRLLNLQYRIPATQTSNLLNKAAGRYNTTITYSIVAP